MGTRHLICVVSGGQYRVAQYGQWDGYPEGQGVNVLGFCRRLAGQEYLTDFKRKAEACRFLNQGELDALGATNWKLTHPHLSRDLGAKILDVVVAARDGLELVDRSSFAADSLFCEWAYVVDLDAMRLEVYQGFNKNNVDPAERFASVPPCRDEYKQVRFVRAWHLSDLPSNETFVACLTNE